MHSINAIFLIGDTALNCLVSSCIEFHLILNFHCLCLYGNLTLLPFALFSLSLGFEWDTFAYGQWHMWFSNGLFMLALISGISLCFLVFVQLLRKKTHYTSLSNVSLLVLKNRWPYPFLDLSSSYAPLWYELYSILIIFCKIVTKI